MDLNLVRAPVFEICSVGEEQQAKCLVSIINSLATQPVGLLESLNDTRSIASTTNTLGSNQIGSRDATLKSFSLDFILHLLFLLFTTDARDKGHVVRINRSRFHIRMRFGAKFCQRRVTNQSQKRLEKNKEKMSFSKSARFPKTQDDSEPRVRKHNVSISQIFAKPAKTPAKANEVNAFPSFAFSAL